jgi:hypothetical protein
MANVNLKSLTTVLGENANIANIPISPSGIVACESNQVLKVNSLYITNIGSGNSTNITADLYNGSTVLSHFAKDLTIGAGGTVNIVTSETPTYVTEGQSIRLTASASGSLSGFISYERIS